MALPTSFSWMSQELRAWEGILSHALRVEDKEQIIRAQQHIDYYRLLIARASH